MSVIYMIVSFTTYLEHQREVELERLGVDWFDVVSHSVYHQPPQKLVSVQQILLQSHDNHTAPPNNHMTTSRHHTTIT